MPISATVMWVAYRLECLNRVMAQPRPSIMPHSTVNQSTTYEAKPSVCPTRWTAWPAVQSGAMTIWQWASASMSVSAHDTADTGDRDQGGHDQQPDDERLGETEVLRRP